MQMKSIPWNQELKRGSHLPNLLSYFRSSLKTFVNNTFYSPCHLVHFDMWPAADQIVTLIIIFISVIFTMIYSWQYARWTPLQHFMLFATAWSYRSRAGCCQLMGWQVNGLNVPLSLLIHKLANALLCPTSVFSPSNTRQFYVCLNHSVIRFLTCIF